jgi:uncharacterized repeat protein (TIGR01451 family)
VTPPAGESADLSITKTDDADPVTAGTDLTYTISVANAGPDDATNVVVTDPLPAGAAFVSATGGGTESGGTVTWNLGTVANGGSTDVTVTVLVDQSQTAALSNTASVTSDVPDPDGSNDSATENTTVTADAALTVVKSTTATTVSPGAQVEYTISVSNAGPSDATNVVVTDALPAGTTFVSATGGGTESTGTVTWAVGALANGGSTAFTITLQINTDATGDIQNTAVVTSDTSDPDSSDDTSSVGINVDPVGGRQTDVGVRKTADHSSVSDGDTVDYTISVTNNGPATATGVVVGDELPSGLIYEGSTATKGTYQASTSRWQIGTLAVGETASMKIRAKVKAADGATSIVNHADVLSLDQRDTNKTNDTAAKSISLRSPGSHGGPSGQPGGTGGTAFTGSNIGVALASMLVLAFLGSLALTEERRRRRAAR